MTKKLYERDLYTNPDIDFLISKSITEYDIKNAGYNLIKYYNLLPESKIDYLSKLSKSDRTIQIGIYEKDKDLAKALTESFKNARKMFFEENNLKDEDILSIKKDAIFVIGKECQITEFGNINFVKKHKYTSYHKFDNIEMYYRLSNNSLDIKGIRDEILLYHEKYFLTFLKRVFRLLENNNQKELIKFMKWFISNYKTRNLDIEYYRELSPDSLYILNEDVVGKSKYFNTGIDNINYTSINDINISYNYIKYILPIIQRFYFKEE